MPVLRLIDSEDNMPPEGSPFGMVPEIVNHVVSDRDGARRVLAYDLQQTADPVWAASILDEFDSGTDVITRANGMDHHFTVKYLED